MKRILHYAHLFIVGINLAMAPIAHAANITVDSIESNQAASIQEESFIDQVKRLVTEHKTVALSIAGTVVVVSAATIDHLFLNGAVRTALKNGLVAIMPFLPKETTKSKEINDQSWTTGQKIGAGVIGIGGLLTARTLLKKLSAASASNISYSRTVHYSGTGDVIYENSHFANRASYEKAKADDLAEKLRRSERAKAEKTEKDRLAAKDYEKAKADDLAEKLRRSERAKAEKTEKDRLAAEDAARRERIEREEARRKQEDKEFEEKIRVEKVKEKARIEREAAEERARLEERIRAEKAEFYTLDHFKKDFERRRSFYDRSVGDCTETITETRILLESLEQKINKNTYIFFAHDLDILKSKSIISNLRLSLVRNEINQLKSIHDDIISFVPKFHSNQHKELVRSTEEVHSYKKTVQKFAEEIKNIESRIERLFEKVKFHQGNSKSSGNTGGSSGSRSSNKAYGNPRDEALTLFGLSSNYSKAELKTKYHQLIQKWHPDRNGNSTESVEMSKKINAAYETLK